ncbi:MAG TPA: hypothetical protein VMV72_11610 [Verrucomicrobiae bacterium]|nr:hypothetical protein [Verrucomicrobiae bacterium]
MARADTITLKDGTVLEGDITTQDDSSVSIYLEFAHGTITETRQIKKSDIAQIVRSTAEQRAATQEKRDYDALGKYQLSSEESYRLDYYDDVINNVFRRFLNRHPNSAYETNVTALITQWQAERNLVAAGSMRFHGRWLPAAEGLRLAKNERCEKSLQKGRWSISQGQFESAIQELLFVLTQSEQAAQVAQAKPLVAVAFQKEIDQLDHQKQQLEADVPSAQQRVDQAQHAFDSAEASLKQAMGNHQSFAGPAPVGSRNQTLGGNSQAIVQNQVSVNAARRTLANEQANLDQMRYQLEAVTHRLAAVRSQASTTEARWGISPPSAVANAASPPPTVKTAAPDVLVGTTTWVRNNWVIMAGALLVFLFVLSRIIKG